MHLSADCAHARQKTRSSLLKSCQCLAGFMPGWVTMTPVFLFSSFSKATLVTAELSIFSNVFFSNYDIDNTVSVNNSKMHIILIVLNSPLLIIQNSYHGLNQNWSAKYTYGLHGGHLTFTFNNQGIISNYFWRKRCHLWKKMVSNLC